MFGLIGLVPVMKNQNNMTIAKIKFIVTQAISTRDLAHHFFEENESLSSASSLPGSSHLMRTNPQIGSQFSVYSVHLLSRPRLFAFGGIPMPNSSTFIFVYLAVRKCPISWMKTIAVKTISVRSIQRKIVIQYNIGGKMERGALLPFLS